MSWCTWYIGWAAIALPASVWAQVSPPVGNGLQGAYHTGANFERYVSTRRDTTIDFDWHEREPMAGVTAGQFSVRWTGWLVAPASGRYTLRVISNGGVRLWLDKRRLLNNWQSEGPYFYQRSVNLTAGRAYPLRLEYCQRAGSAHVRLAWKPPVAPVATVRLRNEVVDTSKVAVIPVRYLFSDAPASPPPMVAAPTRAEPVGQPAASPLGQADSTQALTVADRLAAGASVTLRTLYFEQGQAALLPTAQASLDTLAQALGNHPALRLEVQGHTDNQGDPGVNQRLSKQRAEAVCAYLVAHGVAANRLRAVGYGGSRPVADNRLPAQRSRNRRVVLKPLGR